MKHRLIKKLGQNFLIQPAIANKIVASLAIDNESSVFEIGPGNGALTEFIVALNPAHFHAVEIDKRWSQTLTERFGNQFTLFEQDILSFDISLLNKFYPLKIIGNIPYNITSPILFRILDWSAFINCAVLMTQKELARRITASPNSKEYGILSVIFQTLTDVQYLFEVKKENFTPVPKVDSSVIKIILDKDTSDIQNIALFRKVVRGVFNYRRKMLRNSLSRIFDQSVVYSLDIIDLSRRPEQLTIAEFKQLANAINQIIK